jgi:hypothetical protein
MSKGRNQHVVPRPNGWAVRGENAKHVTVVTRTQKEAMDVAREIAQQQHSDLLIHARSRLWRQRDGLAGGATPAGLDGLGGGGRARQDSNLRPTAPEAVALSS